MLDFQRGYTFGENLILDVNSQANSRGIYMNAQSIGINNVTVKNFTTIGMDMNGGGFITNSRITAGIAGCTEGVHMINGGIAIGVMSDTNHCHGFFGNSGSITCIFCIAANNIGAAVDGFNFQNTAYNICANCIAYGNGEDGFQMGIGASTAGRFWNTWAWGNVRYSFNSTVTAITAQQMYFAYNGYASGTLNNITAGYGDVTLTADPSTAGASLNFALNNAAGGGALLKGVAGPIPGGTGYLSIGPIQPFVNSSTATLGASSGFIQ